MKTIGRLRKIRCGTFATVRAALVATMTGGGCGPVEIASGWRQEGITPDGSAADWGNELVYVEKLNADIGMVNDDSILYVCLILRDKAAQRQLVASGLKVWFEPQNEGEVRTGVHFPVGLGGKPPGEPAGSPRGGPGEDSARPQRGSRPRSESPEQLAPLDTEELEILVDSTRTRFRTSEVPGVRVAIERSPSRALVYELAMPLARCDVHPYAVGARPGDVVELRFEVASLQRPKGLGGPGGSGQPGDGPGEPGEEEPDGGFPGGGAGGPAGGMGRPGGGGMGGPGGGGMGGPGGFGGPGGPGSGGRRPAGSEPWQVRVKVRLAPPA